MIKKGRFQSEQILSECSGVFVFVFVIRDTKASYSRIFILTLKDRMQPMKRRTAKTRHMLLVDMISSLYGNVPGWKGKWDRRR